MRFPNDTERHAIFGMTGSGKTRFAVWALSRRSYDTKPWIVVDFKGDELIAAIPGLREISVKDNPPKKPGVYVVRPLPHELEQLDELLWKIWARGNTGVYIDEVYMLERFNKAYRAILTQGRAKRIPVMSLSQKPFWISPFILSESEYLTTFFLHTKSDRERIREFMPGVDPMALQKFHSAMWSVKDRELLFLGPVPGDAEILERFQQRMPRRFFL